MIVLLFQLGFGTGYTVKTVTKVGWIIVASSAISLYTLNYFQFIEIKWQKIQEDSRKLLHIKKEDVMKSLQHSSYFKRTLATAKLYMFTVTGLCYGTGFVLGLLK